MNLVTYIVIMAGLVLFSAYFSATETAFSSLNKTRLKAMAEGGDKRAEKTLKLAEKYDRLISTILIGNNIVNILISSLGTVLFLHYAPKPHIHQQNKYDNPQPGSCIRL